MNPSSHQKKNNRQYGDVTSLGWNMAIGMGVFSFLGYYIDAKRGEGFGFTLTGMFLGFLYCGYEVWKLIHHQNEIDSNKGRTPYTSAVQKGKTH